MVTCPALAGMVSYISLNIIMFVIITNIIKMIGMKFYNRINELEELETLSKAAEKKAVMCVIT